MIDMTGVLKIVIVAVSQKFQTEVQMSSSIRLFVGHINGFFLLLRVYQPYVLYIAYMKLKKIKGLYKIKKKLLVIQHYLTACALLSCLINLFLMNYSREHLKEKIFPYMKNICKYIFITYILANRKSLHHFFNCVPNRVTANLHFFTLSATFYVASMAKSIIKSSTAMEKPGTLFQSRG